MTPPSEQPGEDERLKQERDGALARAAELAAALDRMREWAEAILAQKNRTGDWGAGIQETARSVLALLPDQDRSE